MNNLNIPLFRAKKIDSDEYVIGFYIFDGVRHLLLVDRGNLVQIQIDPTTLAIHFPDMLDSQGNKIFASLSASGKGGDIMKDDEYYGIAKYVDCKFVVEYENCFDVIDEGNFEVIGIQK